jgi:DNA-binding beta-propeller fold protein YncE
MDVQPAEDKLQWPPLPAPAKAAHAMTIRGFNETGTSAAGLLYGRREDRIIRPVSVAAGPGGILAVADTGCMCVHLYQPSAQQYHKVLNEDMESLISPVGVAFDDEARLYIADSVRAKIYVFDRQLSYLFTIDRTSDGLLQRPTGLAFDREKKVLYAVDTVAHKVHAFDTKGAHLFSFGERGVGNGQFNFPAHIFWSAPGTIYVTDSMNFRVQIFGQSGNFLAAFGRQGDGSGDFSSPKGVASDKDRIIYVVDSLFDTIQLFNGDSGEFLLAIGGRGTGPGEFWLPSGIFIDDNDKLYVCDTYNQRVQVFQLFRRLRSDEGAR